jgi:hypothetical protein
LFSVAKIINHFFKRTTMKTPNTLKLSTGIVPFAIFCTMLFSCKKDDNNDMNTGPEVNNDLFNSVTLASTGGSFSGVSSAVPDATSQFIYFSTLKAPVGVYKTPAAGGNATPVFTGAPFVKPIDLVLSSDNQNIFVADEGASAVLMLGIAGSTPAMIMGTSGTKPVAIDLMQRSGMDEVYFCGTNSSDGQPAVFEIAAGGASSATLRFKGAPLMNPSGIVSAADGTLYISDKNGKIFKLTTSNQISEVASGISMGNPAGIALTPDDAVVAVSSKSVNNATAQVYAMNLQTGKAVVFNKVIGANSNPGGLHVARNASGSTGVYAWADLSAGTAGGGLVFKVNLH